MKCIICKLCNGHAPKLESFRKMKKGVAKPRFVGQLILGILEIVVIFAVIPYVNELGGSLLSPSIYWNMIIIGVLAFVVVHGLWRIIDGYTTMRYAD